MSLSFIERLHSQQVAGRYRTRIACEAVCGATRRYHARDYISFCHNDYLGLAQHPQVIEAFQTAAARYGVGSSGSSLLGGYSKLHRALEESLAEFSGYPRVLIFSTGYMANIGVLTALLTQHDAIFADRLSHASLLDAARFSGAQFRRYRHLDNQHLEEILMACSAPLKFIVSDGVFSMDGDMASLTVLQRLARQFSAYLLIDDSHGLGVLGRTGGGISQHYGVQPDILIGGFGKALGSFGAFVASNVVLHENLVQFARTYMYTTALPPAVAAATYASLRLLLTENWRHAKLAALIRYFRQAAQSLSLPLLPSSTPIQPLIIGDNAQAMSITEALWQRGLLVHAIRPPTVPPQQARLRITLSVLHEPHHIDCLLDALAELGCWNSESV